MDSLKEFESLVEVGAVARHIRSLSENDRLVKYATGILEKTREMVEEEGHSVSRFDSLTIKLYQEKLEG